MKTTFKAAVLFKQHKDLEIIELNLWPDFDFTLFKKNRIYLNI